MPDTMGGPAHAEAGPSKNQLGTLNGVFFPCLLNIFGVILFLRLGWAVGQAGLGQALLVLGLSETIAVLTVLSLTAIVTNGAFRRVPQRGRSAFRSRQLQHARSPRTPRRARPPTSPPARHG